MKKIVFLTATRAEFGKMKTLIDIMVNNKDFKVYIYVTGMHLLRKCGYTYNDILECNYKNVYPVPNQSKDTDMDLQLANTIIGFGNFVKEINPDLIIVHSDRIEALAGAIVGSFNNILTGHIGGGEYSGTIDESIRHSTSKLSHFHFVYNEEAKKRLIQMGEKENTICILGDPGIDTLLSDKLPSIEYIKKQYEIPYDTYSIFVYHPVTTELKNIDKDIKIIINSLKKSKRNYIIILPNNDTGSDIILRNYKEIHKNNRIMIFPSIKFDHYLTLLKKADFIIGNSSSGILEAEVYGIPIINIGTRQKNRSQNEDIINVDCNEEQILMSINNIKKGIKQRFTHGRGDSNKRFLNILNSVSFWKTPLQK